MSDKFIQITGTKDTLFALDEDGRVWRFFESGATQQWMRTSDKREVKR